jgi:hypothetical protein
MQRARTKRIYNGPPGHEKTSYWTVKISDAKQAVVISASVMHALQAYPGVTVGCGLSMAAVDPVNASAFPHPAYLASFTKRTALIVDKKDKAGQPCHAVRYEHYYGHITDKNDNRTLKRLVKEDPSIMDREFVLRPPHKRSGSGVGSGKTPPEKRGVGDHGKAFAPRGALLRAVKAGIIGEHVADQLTMVANSVSATDPVNARSTDAD